MPYTPAGRSYTELVLEVFRWHGRLIAFGDGLSKPFGLTAARWQILGAIDDAPLSVAQIGRRMGITRQNAQRLADALAEDGLVRYAPNPDHRRAKLVCMTDAGRKAFDQVMRRQTVWANRMGSKASSAELGTALKVIKAFHADMQRAEGA